MRLKSTFATVPRTGWLRFMNSLEKRYKSYT